MASSPAVKTKKTATSHTIKRRVSTLHRESQITLETPDTAESGRDVHGESQNGTPTKVNGRMESAMPKNEFERRLLLAKKGRKAPVPDISQIE